MGKIKDISDAESDRFEAEVAEVARLGAMSKEARSAYYATLAQDMRLKFDALVESGFTEDQALYLATRL